MTRTRWMLALAALALMLACWPVPAQCAVAHSDGSSATLKDGEGVVIINGTKWYVVTGTAGGAANVNVVNGPETVLYSWPNVKSTKLITGNADSTGAWPALGANHIKAYIRWTFEQGQAIGGPDSVKAALIKLEWRRHRIDAVDSLSSYLTPFTQQRASAVPATPGTYVPDTLGSIAFAVATNGVRVQPNQTTEMGNDQLVWLQCGGCPMRNIVVEFADPATGADKTAAYVSLKISVVAQYDNNLALVAAGGIAFQIDFEMTR